MIYDVVWMLMIVTGGMDGVHYLKSRKKDQNVKGCYHEPAVYILSCSFTSWLPS